MTTHASSKMGIMELLSHAWDNFKKEWKVLVGMLIIMFVIGYLRRYLGPLSILVSIANIWLSYNMLKTYIRVVRGQKVSINDLFEWGKDYLPRVAWFFVVTLLLSLAVGLGLVLLIVPGIYIAIRFGLATYLTIDKNMSASDAFAASWNTTKGHELQIFMLILAGLVGSFVGFITLGLGLLIVVPVITLAATHLYTRLVHGQAGANTTHKEPTLETSH